VTIEATMSESDTGMRTEAPPSIVVTDLVKTFQRANRTQVVPIDHISLTVAQGEFVVLLGPSGCGKTTLLRCIAGLETASQGKISINGRPVFDAAMHLNEPPERRRLGMIFQSYALWPHLTVRQNVGYPLKARGVKRAEIKGRVEEILSVVGIGEVADQLPGRLSGGQQQRVALARALVAEPDLVLFDEPLSNVDAKVREELRAELVQMQRRLGFTALYVTHDQAEAMELADRIAVLRSGKIAQLDKPAVVYRRPTDRYVADFVGSVNELPVNDVPQYAELFSVLAKRAGLSNPVQAVLWRPEATRVARGEQAADDVVRMTATVRTIRYLGVNSETLCELVDGRLVRMITIGPPALTEGSGVILEVDLDDLILFDA
jgi:iron(III) transport system ATP-binding protein